EEADKIINNPKLSAKEQKKQLDNLRKKHGIGKGDFKGLVTRRLSSIYKDSAKRLDSAYKTIEKEAKSEIKELEKEYGKDSAIVETKKADLEASKKMHQQESEQLKSKGDMLKSMYPSFWERLGNAFKGIAKVFSQVLDIVATAVSFIPGVGQLASAAMSAVSAGLKFATGDWKGGLTALMGVVPMPGGKVVGKVVGQVAKQAGKQAGKQAAKQAARKGASTAAQKAASTSAQKAASESVQRGAQRMSDFVDKAFTAPSELVGSKVAKVADDVADKVGKKIMAKGGKLANKQGAKGFAGRQMQNGGDWVRQNGGEFVSNGVQQGIDEGLAQAGLDVSVGDRILEKVGVDEAWDVADAVASAEIDGPEDAQTEAPQRGRRGRRGRRADDNQRAPQKAAPRTQQDATPRAQQDATPRTQQDATPRTAPRTDAAENQPPQRG
ncbi:MAG: hypothetical protein AAFV29_20300, partial [Myxococcota bacterium]